VLGNDELALIFAWLPPACWPLTIVRLSKYWAEVGEEAMRRWPRRRCLPPADDKDEDSGSPPAAAAAAALDGWGHGAPATPWQPLWALRQAWGQLSWAQREAALVRAAWHGDAAAVRWVLHGAAPPLALTGARGGPGALACLAAAQQGHLEALQLLRGAMTGWGGRLAARPLLRGARLWVQHIHISMRSLQQEGGMLHTSVNEALDADIIATAASAGATRVLDYMLTQHVAGFCSLPPLLAAPKVAAQSGRLAVLQWCVEQRLPLDGCCEAAEQYGRFECAAFASRHGGCASGAPAQPPPPPRVCLRRRLEVAFLALCAVAVPFLGGLLIMWPASELAPAS
jgi:hypothetical protein